MRADHGGKRGLIVALAGLAAGALACNAPGRSSVAEIGPQGLPEVPTQPPLTSTPTDTPTPTLTYTPTFTPTLTETATVTATYTPTITPSLTPSLTPTVTDTLDPFATPSATPSITPTHTLTPYATSSIPTATPIPAQPGVNLLANAGFEGAWRPVIFPEVSVFYEWEPWYCSEPYTAARCPIPEEWDPFEPWMKRPEYTPGNRLPDDCETSPYLNRVQTGCNSQQWFAFAAVARAGVYQVVRGLQPGRTYELSAYVMLWSMEGSNPRNPTLPCVQRDSQNICTDWGTEPYTSDIATQDDRTAIFAMLGVDTTCGTDAFAPGVRWSRDFGYTDGLYDRFGRIQMTFVAARECATVYIGGYNRFAKIHNNWYVDSAALR